MVGFFIRWLVNTLALIIVVNIVPGISAGEWQTVAVAALVLGFLNAFLRPLIILFTLPLHVMSLGLFTLVTNGLMLYAVSKIVEGFYVAGFWSAFWGALFFSVISFVLNFFIDPQGKVSVHVYQRQSRYPGGDEHVIDVEGKSKDEPKDRRNILDL